MVGMVLLQRFVFNNLKQWTFVDHRLVDATPHHPTHAHFKLKKKNLFVLSFCSLTSWTNKQDKTTCLLLKVSYTAAELLIMNKRQGKETDAFEWHNIRKVIAKLTVVILSQNHKWAC